MSIFQKSVLNSISQDESKVALRWAEYQKYLAKIDYVKSVKEEKYQDGFLKDVFETCLGYTLDSTNPSDYNLERERKNETDGKKADGAIFVDGKVIAVVELKAQDTKNLDKATDQAFGYLVSNSDAKYVIVSNFDELRFYFDKKTAYEKFSLFNLEYEEFKKLHLLLSYESIKDEIPLRLKEKTTTFEQTISKDLYKDFSSFRAHLFENIVKNNDLDKALLLRLAQKICDRIIFILFAEDRGLLQANTIKEIRNRHSQDGFGDRSMFDYYKLYFDAIDEGNERLNIPKYNGGLFAKDEQLNSLIIDDEVLDMEAQKLSDYDFASEVGVNILGHIFEQSLTDLEEIQANIDKTDYDKSKSKRKKDGVFYTPEYITKYIVDNTLGKLCKEKREELSLTEVKAPKNPKKLNKTETQIKQNLEEYKQWLFSLKILDPACGSGAFLNQALEHLIHEHKQLQNDLALMGDLFSSYTVEESVLEHNLYGVDINEDAVEIAKLSLWLRTAKKGRPLTKLADKILCANSLLDMPFEEGSFDCIIGNPPYVRNTSLSKLEKEVYSTKYFVADGQYDLYVLFNELSLSLAKNSGLIGFIQPNKFLSADYGIKTLNFIVNNSNINIIKNVSLDKIFEDASVYPYIFIFEKKSFNINFDIKNISIFDICKKESLIGFENEINSNKLVNKITKLSTPLSNFTNYIKRGVPNNKLEFIDTGKFKAVSSTDLTYPYCLGNISNTINYKDNKFEETKIKEFHQPLILLPRTVLDIRAILSINNTHILDRIYYLSLKENCNIDIKTILLVLNSKLTTFYYEYFFGSTKIGGGYIDLKGTQIATLPIPKNIINENNFVSIANLIIELNDKLYKTKYNFIKELELEKIPKRLQNFEELEFEDFVKEYKKVKKLKFANKLEERNFKNDWKALFENDKKEVLALQKQINQTDKEIDNMVYKLYELTEDEIKIVEDKNV